jgi:hypothetical protein
LWGKGYESHYKGLSLDGIKLSGLYSSLLCGILVVEGVNVHVKLTKEVLTAYENPTKSKEIG